MGYIFGATTILALVAGWSARAHGYPRLVQAYRILRETDFVAQLHDRGITVVSVPPRAPEEEPGEDSGGGPIVH
jgi:hypothetical protein